LIASECTVNVYTDLKQATERAARTETETRLAYEQLATTIRSLAALRDERSVLGAAQRESSKQLAELEAAATLHEHFHHARKKVDDTGAALAEVQQRAVDVTAAESYIHSRETVERLTALLAPYDKAATKLAELSAARSILVAPSRAQLETLREAAVQVDALQATIPASALSLNLGVSGISI
jgi:hypothetical protein